MTTPTISNVSGTVATGQTLTITGTNFANESTTNWDDYFVVTNPNAYGFEGTSPAADGYHAVGPAGGSYDSTVKLMGSKSMRFQITGSSPPNITDYVAIDPEGGDSSELWIRFYARWVLNAGGWPTSHIKMVDSQGGPGNQYYFQPKHDSGGALPTQFDAVWNEGAGNVDHFVDIPSGQLEEGRWYCIELHWKTSSPNIFTAWIDNTQVIDDVPPLTDYQLNYVLEGFINAAGTSSEFDLEHWWDNFVISSSRVNPTSIIEIGNNSDYATATKNYQQPTTLSETSNIIKCHLTNPNNLGAGPYWMWVTNNLGERSAAFSLSGQGSTIASSILMPQIAL